MFRILAAVLAALTLALPVVAEGDAQVAKGNNEFAVDLYHKLRVKDGNLFLSPYSITTALAMTWAGAKGNTDAEMSKALRFSLPQETLHDAIGTLTKELNSRVYEGHFDDDPDKGRKPFELVVANALWGQKGYPFRREYVELVGEAYDAGLTELDFAGDTEAARKAINGWVEGKTNQRIKGLIAQGQLSPDARLVLTNAIYFKAVWRDAFMKEATAATAVIMEAGGAPAEPISLTIDRPFLYLIRDTKSGAILFLGRIQDPRS